MNLASVIIETEVLQRVQVRLLAEHERPEFDRLLTEKHYLHVWVLTGQSLRYVAELDVQWLALLAFSAASLHLKACEKWIGWSPRQRARCLARLSTTAASSSCRSARVTLQPPTPAVSSLSKNQTN